MSKLCNFYVEVKDLKEDEAKIFSCPCRRHKDNDIQVVKLDGVVRQLSDEFTANLKVEQS
jgi:hypothetical protein